VNKKMVRCCLFVLFLNATIHAKEKPIEQVLGGFTVGISSAQNATQQFPKFNFVEDYYLGMCGSLASRGFRHCRN
jgi:hypothetical protein